MGVIWRMTRWRPSAVKIFFFYLNALSKQKKKYFIAGGVWMGLGVVGFILEFGYLECVFLVVLGAEVGWDHFVWIFCFDFLFFHTDMWDLILNHSLPDMKMRLLCHGLNNLSDRQHVFCKNQLVPLCLTDLTLKLDIMILVKIIGKVGWLYRVGAGKIAFRLSILGSVLNCIEGGLFVNAHILMSKLVRFRRGRK